MKKGLPAPPPTRVGEGGGKEGRKEAEGQSKTYSIPLFLYTMHPNVFEHHCF